MVQNNPIQLNRPLFSQVRAEKRTFELSVSL
jgi:hypothetical protein